MGCHGDPKAPAAKGVPVVTAQARSGDLAVTLTGLGTIAPLSTVTVHSRVDGQIVRIAFKEGQPVRQGDLLVEIDPRPFQVQLTQAEGQLAKDQAALNNARMDLARFEALVKDRIIAQQQLDAQRALVAQNEATVKSDEGAVASARLSLTYSRVSAPISGRAGLRQVDLGNVVRASDPSGLLTIAQLQPITALFTIPADQIPQVQAKLQAGRTLAVEAYDRDFARRLATGTLQAIDNQIDPATGTLKLRAQFPNGDGALFPNQFVNVRLQVDTLKGAVLVPTAAIQRSPTSTFVYVVKGDVVELREVEIQATDGDRTALRKGLAAGDVVVTDGVDRLRPGSKVSTSEPKGTAQDGRKDKP
jgi:multidrug efflux system membrane fusion protein